MLNSFKIIGIKVDNGTVLLIHIGIDTVHLKGEGFTSRVEQGDLVEQGQLLMEMDLAYIAEHAPSIITPIVFTNFQEGQSVKIKASGHVEADAKDIVEITSKTEEI